MLTLCPTIQEGRQLSLEKPELKALVSEKLEDLHKRWDELETTTQAKARSLFDANRAELFAQSCSALESWLLSLQAQLHSDDYGKDLTGVNILLKKQQVWGWGAWVGVVDSGGRGREPESGGRSQSHRQHFSWHFQSDSRGPPDPTLGVETTP